MVISANSFWILKKKKKQPEINWIVNNYVSFTLFLLNRKSSFIISLSTDMQQDLYPVIK